MFDKNVAIEVENISKIYRIGTKDELQDNLAQTVFGFFKNPIKNYRKYRSLYKFDDAELYTSNQSDEASSDIIWAVKDVSFDVKKGELIGIIGRNGAGKSTLLKILCRITDPTKGHARIRGRISSLLEVGTGFHNELTGRENVYLNGTILGMTKVEIKRKFDEIVHFSGIEKFIDTPVKRYSSGMKVRLAFSVAAHLEPEILIIDEVLAVGDADFQKKCLNKMEDVGQQGRTVIFVSHNLPAVCRLCERVILLDRGGLVEDGSPAQVVSRYLNSDFGTSASREWIDPTTAPAGDIARLNAVRLQADDGQIRDTIDIRRSFTVEMEYEVFRSGSVLLPVFAFDNEEGLRVFTTVDQDPTWRRQPRLEGRYISTVHIPGNLLAEGMLFITCTLLTMNPDRVQFMERTALAFQIVDSVDGDSARGDYAKNIPGIVRPMLQWTTQFDPAFGEAAIGGL
ncbi:MAG: ABC transporter ATP-binding protein [Desulfosarcina sp.]|nr:ABC transporter ATP-binding protein [Desulfosarcina sp.]